MGGALITFLVFIAILAVFTRETFVVILLYLFVGALLLGRWWSDRVVKTVQFRRKFDRKVFPGETIPVEIEVHNHNWLPAVWLRVQDLYPLDVAEVKTFQQVVSLGPRETTRLHYKLKAFKRGYYTIGPLLVSSGDLLGLNNERSSEGDAEHLTVYPQVIALSEVKLPSHSPMGTLKTSQPIFEDPSRPMGTRDYQAGDSLRRIDWKATAATGKMQTRLFEPSIALGTVIFLNLNSKDYHLRTRYAASELAIVVAASLANWVIARRQAVGFYCNGFDPLTVDNQVVPQFSRKGRPHLMRMLEILARVRTVETASFAALVGRQRVNLSWGTTILIITGSAEKDLFDELLLARRSGLNPVLILCGENPAHRTANQYAHLFHIPVYTLLSDKDLDIWRK